MGFTVLKALIFHTTKQANPSSIQQREVTHLADNQRESTLKKKLSPTADKYNTHIHNKYCIVINKLLNT